jgi:uncharacterized membrane protein (UPF0127 family)/CheY-like chemotaxis protein
MLNRASKLIVNLTRGTVVCETGLIADRPLARMRGLLGQRVLPSEVGLLLRPARSIHTGFMRFPIDAVFLDRDMQIVRLVTALKPWRVASAPAAHAVLEMAQGESVRRELQLGDQLAALHEDGGLPRWGSSGTRVLLMSPDRRFRSVTSALLTRRGCSVTVGRAAHDIAEIAAREGADVVVIDATASLTAAAHEAARIQMLCPAVGVVAVSAEERHLAALPVLAKWGSFDALLAAIHQARHPIPGQEAVRGQG